MKQNTDPNMALAPVGKITCEDGYVLDEGSGIVVEILRRDPGRDHIEVPTIRLWRRYPSVEGLPCRKVILIDRIVLPIKEQHLETWEAYHLAESNGTAPAWVAEHTHVLIKDSKDLHVVNFICEVDLTEHKDQGERICTTTETSVHPHELPDYFVTGSGLHAIASPRQESDPDVLGFEGDETSDTSSVHDEP